MVTVNNGVKFSTRENPNFVELLGLSTDEKGTTIKGCEIGLNSLFLELDTGDFYYFTENKTWVKVGETEATTNTVVNAVAPTMAKTVNEVTTNEVGE